MIIKKMERQGSPGRFTQVIILSVSLFVAGIAHADIELGGYVHNAVGFISDAPAAAEYAWKAIRVRADVSGQVHYFRMYVGAVIGDQSDTQVGWALYEDNGGTVGSLKVSGYVNHYNWSVGTPGNHDFQVTTVHTDRNIVAGNWYWLTTQTSAQGNILISRGRVSGCTDIPPIRKFINPGSYLLFTPPPSPEAFVNDLNEGCYGWSVWQTGGSGDVTPPAPPGGLRIVQ